MRVNEIFYSIQGESTYAGQPCVFVRLTGCNLRCLYCDTRYAYDEGRHLSINEIIDRVTSYQCGLVEITGGEPLIQEETPHLIYRLLEKGFEVLLETNGSLDISPVDERCVKIVDIKCPSSGEGRKKTTSKISKDSPGKMKSSLLSAAKKIMCLRKRYCLRMESANGE